MKLRSIIEATKVQEGSNDSYYAYHNAAEKWAKDTGQPKEKFAYAGTDVQDKYIEPEMKKYGLVPDEYMGKGVTKYRRENVEEKAPSDAVYGIFADGKDISARYSSSKDAKEAAEQLQQNNPKVKYEVKKADPEHIEEGEERSIIRDACVEKLVDMFLDSEDEFESIDALENAVYTELERLDVEDCVDPDTEHGGQRMGDFASGGVLDVIDSSSVIDDVMGYLNVREGKSPHKKGSAKYKKHMAAKHAAMGEDRGFDSMPVEKIRSPMTGKTIEYIILNGEPFDKSGAKLSYRDFYDVMLANNYGSDIAINTAYQDYVEANMNVRGYNPGHPSKTEGRIEDTFATDRIDKHDKPEKKKDKKQESIQVGDELMIETAEGEGIVVPVLHVVGENILVGWDQLAEDIFSEQDTQLAELRKLAGLDEGDMVMYAKPDEVKKAVHDIQKNGLSTSGKFVNWCIDNNCKFSMDFNDPKNLQKAAVAKINFEKETGYSTSGELLNKKPPMQLDLPFKPNEPKQQELDFDEDLDEAEYRGRKVKLNKPTRGDVKKFKVYVKDPKTGNIKKVNFGHGGSSAKKAGQKTMKIRKSNPKARKSFRARHNCDNPGPKTKARYWSCRKW